MLNAKHNNFKGIFGATFIAATLITTGALSLAIHNNANAASNEKQTANSNISDVQYNISYGDKFEKSIKEKYGDAEKKTLEDILKRQIGSKIGNNVAKVEVTINDAIPNRPTFEQLSKNPSLSMTSFGTGGADLSGKIYDESGKLIRETNYKYYSTMSPQTPHSWTWDDAEDAIRVFSDKLTEK